ncbi:iron complex outermembrane recepter protein [Granulicella rosea]|uniref:Iron complex outermembrane recepter protein n=2 Tax=Granulicella rosea TaxID=474952 RepID=A0A239K1B4_9BACT|nr:iron complex outermembrane recepter protein [Granulicella rosea]
MFLRWRIFLMILVLSFAAVGYAQLPQAASCTSFPGSLKVTVSGTVSDSTGARITSATVHLMCGNQVQQARTDGQGHFTLTVPEGSYRLQVEAAGFAAYTKDLTASAHSPTADVALTVQNAANTVTVQAEAGYVANDSTLATKTDTPLLETPQSISVITRDEIDAQAPQSLNEALRYAPGLVAESEGNSSSFWSGSSLQLRGFTPAVYQDGLTDDASGNTLLDTYFYQRIEVLEGPSSVLYGQGNPAGIVNVESKRPMASAFHEVQLGFGTYGRYEGNFDFSGPLLSPHLLYRLTGVGFTEGSQTWFIHPKRLAIAPALTWVPDAKTSLTFLTNYTYNPEVGAYAPIPALGSGLPNPNGKIAVGFFPGDPNFNETKQSFLQVGDAFTRSFDHDLRIEQNLRFTGNRDYAKMIWPEGFEADNATLDRYTFIRHVSFNSILSDQRVVKTLQTGKIRQTFLAGANYTHYKEGWNWGSGDVAPINVFHPVYYLPIATPEISGSESTLVNQTGIYFQDQAALGRLRLSFAGRQDWLSYNDTSNGTVTKQDADKFTVRTGAVYLIGRGLAPYFSYATSFQPDIGLTAAGTTLPPTTGKQYEGGVKYQPEHANMLITADVYDLAQQNVGTTDPTNPNFTIPIGEIRSRGFEVQGHSSLAHRVSIVTSYAYTDSKYSRSNTTGVALNGTTESTQGKYQYGVPLNLASFWADYNLPSAFLHGLGVSAGSRFVGGSWGDNVNSFKVPGATLFDGALHYDFSSDSGPLHGARLQINASNIGNRTYVASCYATDGCYYGAKLTVYGTMRYRW